MSRDFNIIATRESMQVKDRLITFWMENELLQFSPSSTKGLTARFPKKRGVHPFFSGAHAIVDPYKLLQFPLKLGTVRLEWRIQKKRRSIPNAATKIPRFIR
jgi:hypothetical protein